MSWKLGKLVGESVGFLVGESDGRVVGACDGGLVGFAVVGGSVAGGLLLESVQPPHSKQISSAVIPVIRSKS